MRLRADHRRQEATRSAPLLGAARIHCIEESFKPSLSPIRDGADLSRSRGCPVTWLLLAGTGPEQPCPTTTGPAALGGLASFDQTAAFRLERMSAFAGIEQVPAPPWAGNQGSEL